MSELYEFITKRTAKISGISYRKLYGLDAFYIENIPFIIISSDEKIVVKIDDFEVKRYILKQYEVSLWVLSGKAMENWFVLPKGLNKKKNKISPILEMTSKVLLNPKKSKKKRIVKPIKSKKKFKKSSIKSLNKEKKSSLLSRLLKFFFNSCR